MEMIRGLRPLIGIVETRSGTAGASDPGQLFHSWHLRLATRVIQAKLGLMTYDWIGFHRGRLETCVVIDQYG